jgi:hypothetical protein
LESARKWRKNNPDHQAITQAVQKARRQNDPADLQKRYAREAVAYARKLGELIKEPCFICGAEQVEAHHPSYERDCWLIVQWLCGKHHYRANRMGCDFKYYTELLDIQYEEFYKEDKVELERCDDYTN